MSKSRAIRLLLLIGAMAGLGDFFGWQRFHGEEHAAQAASSQQRAPARVAVPQDRGRREGRFPGRSDRPWHRARL